MRIATFNVNSIRSRLPVVVGWMEANQPDVLCLQETKVQDPEFPLAEIQSAGYHAVYSGEKSYNGIAMLSRQKPDAFGFGLDDGGPADAARFGWAKFGPLTVVNTYVPQGREITHAMYAYKLEWFARLRRWFDRTAKPSDLLLWCGDLNVARTPADVHSPEQYADHVCFHHAAREAFEGAIAWGFEDVVRRRHPEPGLFSFFDYRTINAVKRGIGWRIDYLLASPALAARCTEAAIDLAPRLAEKPSDHTVVRADFTL